jgi:tripartite-type tricarboxylate transporter receptor subunit TctC
MLGSHALAADDDYPKRQVKIIVPFPAGAGPDQVARMLGQYLQDAWGQTVVIENRAGALGSIGAQEVARSAPDGYTLLMGTFANAVNPSLQAKLPYDAHKDFAAVALVARSFNIVVVNPASPIKSIADLIAAAKAEPDKLSYGTYGTGTSAHLAGELFKHMAKVNLTTVPYKGAAPAITDLIGGQIQVMFTTVASCASLVEAGQLRAIAVTSAERSPAFPLLPTMSEAGVPGYAAEAWYGLYAPAGTPLDIIGRLNKSAAKAVQSEAFRKLGTNEGLVMVAEPPQALDRYFRGEEARWRKVIEEAGIKAE